MFNKLEKRVLDVYVVYVGEDDEASTWNPRWRVWGVQP